MYSKEDSRIEDQFRVYNDCEIEGICVFCSDRFKSRSKKAKYCSQRCANDAHIEKRRFKSKEKRAKHQNCAVCNAPLEQNNNTIKIRLYCSAACKQKSYRERMSGVML